MSQQAYSAFIEQQDDYSKMAIERLRKMYFSLLEDGFPEFGFDSDIRDKFPNLCEFECYEVKTLSDLFKNNRDSIWIEDFDENSIRFCMQPRNDDIPLYLLLDSILVYSGDEEFEEYLAMLAKEKEALVDFIKDRKSNELKERKAQDYQKYLELKMQFEGGL